MKATSLVALRRVDSQLSATAKCDQHLPMFVQASACGKLLMCDRLDASVWAGELLSRSGQISLEPNSC
jgi:hypothetical protein